MSTSILALATAVPPHRICQSEMAERMNAMCKFEGPQATALKELYHNSAIRQRHTVVSDFIQERADWRFFDRDYPDVIPGMTERNDSYKQFALPLALEAAQQAIASWGGESQQITHVISVSCTGIVAPGLEFDLMQALKMSPWTFRLGINFMGCFGAFKGLSIAKALAAENPRHRILLVCTELCSLHIQPTDDVDSLTANALFADGAAAAVVGSQPRDFENPLWMMVDERSYGLENSKDKMSWEASSTGFQMQLSYKVPVLLARSIKPFVDALLKEWTEVSMCDWAIHPGGKSILQVIERDLALDREQTTASWETFADYGNMSSATFLFVLRKLHQLSSKRIWTAGLGFGPGLSMEGVLLRKYPSERTL